MGLLHAHKHTEGVSCTVPTQDMFVSAQASWSYVTAYTCKGFDNIDRALSERSVTVAIKKAIAQERRTRELSSVEPARVADYTAFYTAIQSAGPRSRAEEEELER